MPPPATVAPSGPDSLYRGPLFDTHLHVFLNRPISVLNSAEALCRHLEKEQTFWAVGFFQLLPEPGPLVSRAISLAHGAQGRVVPLVHPSGGTAGVVSGAFAQGKYTEAVLRGYLQAQGPFSGVGEIGLWHADKQTVTFESPQMQTVFQLVNEMKGVVMIHPSFTPIGRLMDVREMEPSIRKYTSVTFLFHGNDAVFDLVDPLMSRYTNVYFTWDTQHILTTGGGRRPDVRLVTPPGRAAISTESFLAGVKQLGVERIVEESLREVLLRLQKHPDRVMWGTDRGEPWNFEDPVQEVINLIARRFIARLPEDLQEKYAFRNALRAFGPYLSPTP